MNDAGNRILLLGGRSEIGLLVAQRLIRKGVSTVILAARNANELNDQEAVLLRAGALTVQREDFDANDLSQHADLLSRVAAQGEIDIAIVAFGILGNQEQAERDASHAVDIVHTDYVAHVSILTHLGNVVRRQGSGQLIVFSSVAGIRVRRANYVYGSAKAGLDGFATGLAMALHGTGGHVLLIRPGFVIGRMTSGMAPAPWSSTPDGVADAVMNGLRRGSDIVWVPGLLRWVFALSRFVPTFIWRRMPR